MRYDSLNRSASSPLFDYVALLLGVLLFGLANGNASVAVAAWLFPIFILRFVRRQGLLACLLIALPLYCLALIIAWQGAVPLPGKLYYAVMVGLGTISFLAFLADRFFNRNLTGLASTFAFPIFYTAIEFLVVPSAL